MHKALPQIGKEEPTVFCCPIGSVHVLHREYDCGGIEEWECYCSPAMSAPSGMMHTNFDELKAKVQQQLAADSALYEKRISEWIAAIRQSSGAHFTAAPDAGASRNCSSMPHTGAADALWVSMSQVQRVAKV